MNRWKCRLGMARGAWAQAAVALLCLVLLACGCRPRVGKQDRFVQFALRHNLDWRGDSIGGRWPDSLPPPAFAYDSLHDEIAGAQYAGTFSLSPLNAITCHLYQVDVVGDTAREYLLYVNHCNFSMRNEFEFHFFEAQSTAELPFASTAFVANFVDRLYFQKISQRSYPDLLVHWDQRSLAYLNAGIDIFQIGPDTVYEIFSQDTLFFDWNYFGKDSLGEWPVRLQPDEAYREMARLSTQQIIANEPLALQLHTQKEVVQDCDTCAEGDLTQLRVVQPLGVDTLTFLYDATRHRYESPPLKN